MVENNSVFGRLEVAINIQAVVSAVSVGILCVIVPADNDEVPAIIEVLDLSVRDRSVRGTYASRNYSQNLVQRSFHELNLLINLRVAKRLKIRVAPCVGANLMTMLVGISKRTYSPFVVDASVVVAIDKEGSLHSSTVERIHDPLLIDVRSVVECHGQTL